MDGGFRQALLRQDGIEPGVLPAPECEKIMRLLARHRAGNRWLKWGTLLAWILTVVVYVAGPIQAHFSPPPNLHGQPPQPEETAWHAGPKLFLLRVIMPIEAAVLSIWLYLRTRRVGRRQLQLALAACQTELSALPQDRWRSRDPSG